MPDPIPACFRGGVAGGKPAAAGTAGPSLTTSVYETHLGLVALTWSRTVLGLSLRAGLRLNAGGSEDFSGDDDDFASDEVFRFRVRPWLFWKRRGTRRFPLRDHRRHQHVDLSWDLCRARFPPGGESPEPSSGYFVSVAVDGEILLVAGDLVDEALKKAKSHRPVSPISPNLISRREHVVLGDSGSGGRSYRTRARLGGEDREISIEIGGKEKEREVGMWVEIDRKRILYVRRLRWKFRGSERVEVESGARVQISWDLHDWFFPPAKDEAPATAGVSPVAGAAAVFVLRFEREGGEEGHFGKTIGGEVGEFRGVGGYSGKSWNWSEGSSGEGGGERRRRRRRSLRKTASSSSSSASTASTNSVSTVVDWASPEEAELRRAEGFSLLVYAWKS